MWLFEACKFEDRCAYAHDKTYLPAQGWWSDDARLSMIQHSVMELTSAGLVQNPEELINTYVPRWEDEPWFRSPYIPKKQDCETESEIGTGESGSESGSDEHEGSSYGDGHSRDEEVDEEIDEDDDPYEWGFSREETQELLAQGVRPWDKDAPVSVTGSLSSSTVCT